MATTPTPTPSAGGFEQYLPGIEQALNIALLALGTAGVVPGGPLAAQLAGALENAANSLITSIKNKSVNASTYLSVLGAEIDVLSTLRAVPGLPQDTINKIDEYSIGVQSGIAGYIASQNGFDPRLYAQVTSIA